MNQVFRDRVEKRIYNSLTDNGMSTAKAEQEAAKRTQKIGSRMAALHELDMVAGGFFKPDPVSMGRADVNSAIGASWKSRIAELDKYVATQIANGNGAKTLTIKLPVKSGKLKK